MVFWAAFDRRTVCPNCRGRPYLREVPEHDDAVLAAVELLPLRQCFLVEPSTVVVEFDLVGRPILVVCVVDLTVLLILFHCVGIPVYPSLLGRSTTTPRRSGIRGSGLHRVVDFGTNDLGFHTALGC